MNSDALAALYQAALDPEARGDLQALLRAILAQAQALTGAGAGAIGLYDPTYDEIELSVHAGEPAPFAPRRSRGQGMIGHVIQTQAPLLLDDYFHSPYCMVQEPAAAEVGAALTLPLLHGGELLGVLSLYERAGSPRRFGRADVDKLAALASLAAGAICHARLRLQAQHSAATNAIVAGIATRFVAARPDQIDAAIDETLAAIGAFAEVDRSYLFRFSADGASLSNTHEWCAPGAAPQIAMLQELPVEAIAWSVSRLDGGRALHFRSLDDLPPEAAIERELLAAQGIQAAAIFPLRLGAATLGFIGFDAMRSPRAWRKYDIDLLEHVAEVFSLALSRVQSERDLHALNQALERRVAERTAALQAGEEQLRFVVEHSLQGILLYQDRRIRFANRALADMAGCTVADLLAASTEELLLRIHPEDRGPLADVRTWDSASQPEQGTLQFRIVRPDGSLRWVICNAVRALHQGQPAVQAVLVDITDLKAAEGALRASKQFIERVTETGPTLVFVHDLQTHGDIYINHAAQEFHGYSLAEVEALGPDLLAAIIHPDDLPAIQANYAHYARLADDEFLEREARVRRQDGNWRWLLVRYSVFQRDADGRPRQVVGVGMDITEIKQSALARQEAEGALRMALAKERELGELKSRFVAMASHEFRTPLGAILAGAETLLHFRARYDEAKIDDRLQRICTQVLHLSQLVDEILSLTGAQGGKIKAQLEALECDGFCREIVEEFAGRPDITHRLEYASEEAPLVAAADARLLRTVFTNLLSNAIKYSPPGSRVRVSVGRRGGMVAFSVADEGIGIPQSDQGRLFEAFHRASNVGQQPGTGLGLSIAKEFVQLMHGAIRCESQAGAGATFEVQLPAC